MRTIGEKWNTERKANYSGRLISEGMKHRGRILSSLKTLAHLNKRVYMFLGLVVLAAIAMTSVRARRYPRDYCEAEELNLVQPAFKVPNVVHFERTGNDALQMSVSDAACVRAALRHQGPVWIHTDNPNKMKDALIHHGLLDRVTLKEVPTSKKSIPEGLLGPSGGIYLKNDVYLLRNLNVLRTEYFSATPDRDIVASAKPVPMDNLLMKTFPDVLLDKDWGALYIFDVLKNCTVKAVRLGTRNLALETMNHQRRRRRS